MVAQNGPRGLERLKFLKRMQGPQILDAMSELWQRFGDTVALPMPFGRSIWLLNDPDDVMVVLQKQAKRFAKGKALATFKLLLGEGVATAEREEWVRHRRLAQPEFARRSLESYTPIIVRTVAEHRRRWQALGRIDDAAPLLLALTQDVIGRILLGADLGPQLDPIREAWESSMAFVLRRTNALLPLPLAWPLPAHRRFLRGAKVIRGCVEGLIEEPSRSANPFIARLRSAAGDGAPDHSAIVSQVLNILFAGHETTASGLGSALLLVLRHPAVAAGIRAELQTVLGRGAPHHAALERQVYLRKVVYETLRLCPPVALFPREALEEVELSAGPVPRGATIILSPYLLHRQPKLWPDPERFDPDRFTSPKLIAPPHFFAFGAGGRACVGDELAINIMILALSEIFRSGAVELDETRPIGLVYAGTLRPERLPLRLRRRDAARAA